MTVTMSGSALLPRPGLLSGALAISLGVAALIHCLLMPEHVAVSTIFGLGFVSAAVAQSGLAALVLLRPRAWVYTAVIGLSIVLMGLFAFNVAFGLPFHVSHPESAVVAAVQGHDTDGEHGAAGEHGSEDHHGAADAHGADDDQAVGRHGDDGLAIGAGEPVDGWGAATQLAQLSSVGLALVLLRRGP